MMKLLLLFVFLITTVGILAHSGDYVDKKETVIDDVEIEGMSDNIAFMLSYSDAVVVANYTEGDFVALCRVEKVIFQKKSLNLKVGQKIYYETGAPNYLDNSRRIVPRGPNLTEVDGFEQPSLFFFLPNMKCILFLRSCEVDSSRFNSEEKELYNEVLNSGNLFKVCNGQEGVIMLNEEIREEDAGEVIKDYLELLIKKQKDRFGYTQISELESFLDYFYNDPDRLLSLDSDITRKFLADCVHLSHALAHSTSE